MSVLLLSFMKFSTLFHSMLSHIPTCHHLRQTFLQVFEFSRELRLSMRTGKYCNVVAVMRPNYCGVVVLGTQQAVASRYHTF